MTDTDTPTPSNADSIPRWNEATVDGTLDPALLARQIRIAFGKRRADAWPVTEDLTVYELLNRHLTAHKIGPKDGPYILQGALVNSPGQRQSSNEHTNYLVLLDHDNGESLDEVGSRFAAEGWFGLFWTTHSHMKPASGVAESVMLEWVEKRGRKGVVTNQDVADYLREVKRIKPEILAGIENPEGVASRDHWEGGVKYICKHDPMPRLRSLMILKEPFVFAQRGGTQREAIEEWKERYTGLATRMGLTIDPKCADPAHLMFLPRLSAGAIKGPQSHEICILAGNPLDFDGVRRVQVQKGSRVVHLSAPAGLAAFSAAGNSGGSDPDIRAPAGHGEYVTRNIQEFHRRAGSEFRAAAWVQAMRDDWVRHEYNDKVDFRCPNEEGHTEPTDSDRAFCVWNAGAGETNRPYWMECQHATCTRESNGDAAWFLDKLCQIFGIEDALTLISADWTPQLWERMQASRQARPEIDTRIEALTQRSTLEDVEGVLRDIARQDEEFYRSTAVGKIAKKTKISVATLRERMQEMRSGGGNGNGGGGSGPVHALPADEASARVIWSDWGFADRCRIAEARLHAINKQNPRIFCRDGWDMVRLLDDGGRVKIEPMVTSDDWFAALGDKPGLVFKKVTMTGEEREIAPPDDIVRLLNKTRKQVWPPLDQIVRVPLFTTEGDLLAVRGYHPSLRVYLDPALEYLPVPDMITTADVRGALELLNEALVDFNFSDLFDGSETAPCKGEEKDKDGWPLPNPERGVSSRAHALCMILQPHVRHLIDGPTPAYHIDKSAPGEGAGFLTDVVSLIAEGEKATAQTMSEEEEEFRKSLTSTLREAVPIVFIDNVNRKIHSGHLAAALTSGFWRDRVLGKTETIKLQIRSMFVIAGINIDFTPELMRRNVPVRLDSMLRLPASERGPSSFKHHPLQSWVAANRGRLLNAVHILIGNWIDQGMPAGDRLLGSFDEWSRVLGGILKCAGVPGFLENAPAYNQTRDTDESAFDTLAQLCWQRYGEENSFSAWEMLDATRGLDGQPIVELPGVVVATKDEVGVQRTKLQLSAVIHKFMEGRTFYLQGEGGKKVGAVMETEPLVREGAKYKLVRVRSRSPIKYLFRKA